MLKHILFRMWVLHGDQGSKVTSVTGIPSHTLDWPEPPWVRQKLLELALLWTSLIGPTLSSSVHESVPLPGTPPVPLAHELLLSFTHHI